MTRNIDALGDNIDQQNNYIKDSNDSLVTMNQANQEIVSAVTNMNDIGNRLNGAIGKIALGAQTMTGFSSAVHDQNKVTDTVIVRLQAIVDQFIVD